ncbi:MAG: hypothetical protein WDN44_01230 [Sphingomonas sp.]
MDYNHVSSRFYLDLTARVRLFGEEKHGVELFGGVKNVFDTDPPPEIRLNGNPLYFDPIGRNYSIGLRGGVVSLVPDALGQQAGNFQN